MEDVHELFFDARDWEKEVRKYKRKVHESKKRERSWENEAMGLRKEWEKERKEKVMLMKAVRKLQGEIKVLATEVDRQNRLRDGLTTKHYSMN